MTLNSTLNLRNQEANSIIAAMLLYSSNGLANSNIIKQQKCSPSTLERITSQQKNSCGVQAPYSTVKPELTS